MESNPDTVLLLLLKKNSGYNIKEKNSPLRFDEL